MRRKELLRCHCHCMYAYIVWLAIHSVAGRYEVHSGTAAVKLGFDELRNLETD